ncbi:Asp-tRNA(Asn)/Glu-tRNA(Gln) amidotransferase subunit GatC [Candidatus Cyanaurora vandensis]|uniref:Asp-tRNA(Asn)/Glu-tRNA(Gln) amidotransferase subunit GatC n=1 Tax=Candidatus Cyanaurora vandensis TaxID=2714958 RepID=UPI00257FECCB|nr:Asp-tRNA(Asn)/Glu-tRNA(Gln) amidotransferase subunit GatC [Candidatus Cyanaurora vandensis]
MIDHTTVQKVARLARLQLTASEETLFTVQLGDILAYIDQLSELDTTGVQPTTRAVELSNVTRPDVRRPPLDPEQLLSQAPQREEAFYRVPRISEP